MNNFVAFKETGLVAKTKSVCAKVKAKTTSILLSIVSFLLTACCCVTPVMADPKKEKVNFGNLTDAEGVVGMAIGLIINLSSYLGVMLLVYGIFKVIYSYISENPEAQTKGMTFAVVGAMLLGLRPILVGLGVISGK